MSSPGRYRASGTPLAERRDYSEHAQRLFDDTGAQAVVLFTGDGIIAGRNQEASQEQAEQASAICTSLFSTALTASELFPVDGAGELPLRQVTVEDGNRFVIVAQAGSNVRVVVYTHPGADLGAVSYKIARFAEYFAPKVAGRAQA
ncbi:roadblock/LC7 domain-containing protein [Kitasatospora albolonga]|uniref:Roadblock/LC7 domain-containing protein n=3 Tax=Streptomycetaceae TaxID=2062 RepID=A0ABU2VVV5_9ACTN|nr:roadblock/LC7 domain-containing protein [Streptomyces griseus]ARF70925.1 hypothetical protein B7C62_00665 [Kitasatospora albolonga]MDT0489012.1 roadblock/LC7 domain-containing protein [Streptomyces griseus]